MFNRCVDASVEAFRKLVTCVLVDIEKNNTGQNGLNVCPFSFFVTVPTNTCVGTPSYWYEKKVCNNMSA